MISYIIVNATTGEIEENCPACGINSTSNELEIEERQAPAGHLILELVAEEVYQMAEISQENRCYKHKADITKATLRAKDRQREVLVNIHGVNFVDTVLLPMLKTK